MAEQRLIDAEALKRRIGDLHFFNYGMALIAVCDAPTVDAVEVVRCKDCKHYDKENFYCELLGINCMVNDFCSYGERRNDG